MGMSQARTQAAEPVARATDRDADERAFIEHVLRAEANAVLGVIDGLDRRVNDAVAAIAACADRGGAVAVAGLGKSGLIGRKISATLSSLGMPSHELHPAEALHGDLGRLRRADLLLAISNSGETEELVTLASIVRHDGVPIIAITGGAGSSTLARLADVALCLGQIPEAPGDLGLAPTCSTTVQLAVGDALALAAAQRRAFTTDEYARHHPGGTLGGLLRPVLDVLRFRAGENLPLVEESLTVAGALQAAERVGRRPGALLVVDAEGVLTGLFTDADARRLIIRDRAAFDGPITAVMTRSPQTLPHTALVRDARRVMIERRRDELPVVDDAGRPLGLLDVQDLVALRVVASTGVERREGS